MILLGCILSLCGVGLFISVHNIIKEKISDIKIRQRLQIQSNTNDSRSIRHCNKSVETITIPIVINNITHSFLYKLNENSFNSSLNISVPQFSSQEISLALQYCSQQGLVTKTPFIISRFIHRKVYL